MCEIKYHVKLPIFVARQWIRHRTANVNEYSARYSILDNEFYIPAPEHLAAQATTNRQGRGAVIEGKAAQRILDLLREDSERAYAGYGELLNEDDSGKPRDPSSPGLARESALSAPARWERRLPASLSRRATSSPSTTFARRRPRRWPEKARRSPTVPARRRKAPTSSLPRSPGPPRSRRRRSIPTAACSP